MSRNATDDPEIASPTFRATVDLPEPDPPAMPITSGFRRSVLAGSVALLAWDVRVPADEREAAAPSRFCIGTPSACATAATSSSIGGNEREPMSSRLPQRSRSSIARRNGAAPAVSGFNRPRRWSTFPPCHDLPPPMRARATLLAPSCLCCSLPRWQGVHPRRQRVEAHQPWIWSLPRRRTSTVG